jgi:hypothetical protein
MPYPAVDADGRELPMTKADPVALGVIFEAAADPTSTDARRGAAA